MLPYWAIIKDSFREALYSYVLWALIIVLSSLLIFLMPFGYSEQLTGDLPWSDVAEWRLMLAALKEGSQAAEPSPSKQVWSRLDKRLRDQIDKLWVDLKKLEATAEKNIKPAEQARLNERVRSILTALQLELDRALGDKQFYDKAAWSGVELSDEAQALVDEDVKKLSDTRLRRRNRLLLEAAYPVLVQKSASVSVAPTYMGRRIPHIPWLPFVGYIGAPPSSTKEAVVDWYRSYISFMMNWPVTMLLVMVGIVATSAIMPRMLEPGSISLLLSKPVTRSGLYIAKFFGGCALMALSATYIVIGIWLIAGIRVGIWDPKVFLCIPLFTFAFAVYFAVSAYVGLWSRSAIVAVLSVIVFWALIWTIGVAKVKFEDELLDRFRLVQVIDAGDAILAVDELDTTYFWDEDAHEWKETFKRPMMFGLDELKNPLVYDEKNKQLLSTAMSFDRGPTLAVGRDADVWVRKNGIATVVPLVDLLVEPDGQVLGVTRLGFVRLTGSALSDDKPIETTQDVAALESAGPDIPLVVDGPMAAAINGDNGQVAVYTGGVLAVYKRDAAGKFKRIAKRELPGSEQKAATLGFGGRVLIVGREDGKLLVLDPKTLRETKTITLEGDTPARFIAAAPGGNWFAVLFQNRRLWLFDAENQKFHEANLWSQGDISAITFTSADTLLVVDKIARVRELELPSLKVVRTFAPNEPPQLGEGWKWMGTNISYLTVHRYLITPFYFLLPKPGELGRTLNYFVTGKATLVSGESEAKTDRDISTDRHLQRNPWTPVWSCGIFIAVMLALGCWMIEKREF